MRVSLRRRLIGTLLALILLAWGTSTLVTGVYAGRVMLEQVDRQLEQYSDLVNFITQVFAQQADDGRTLLEPWSQAALERGSPGPMVIDSTMDERLSPALNIWLDDSLLAVLESSPRFARPDVEGFSYLRLEEDGSQWRVLARYDEPTGLWLLVGMELEAARWAMLGIFGRALFPLLVVLPLTLALLYFGVTRGLGPLKALAEQIARRNPRVLDPVESEDVPEEIQPLVDSLNTLLQRLAHALEGEQRFTANAAHELMTPLAAIKTEVQLCQRQLDDPRGSAMLERIALRVDRASHTVEQLLTLARVDPETPLPTTRLDLQSLLAEIVLETAHLAADRGLSIDLREGQGITVGGSEEALAILLRNLLINAFRYADAGSTVRVRLESDGGKVSLEICNACPALSGEEYQRITERFYRVPGSAGLGAGLGLSIVARIAQQHGAAFSAGADSSGSGFCARVAFPADEVH
ncbi:MAG: ATP-binding protein [Halioglobus sp.]